MSNLKDDIKSAIDSCEELKNCEVEAYDSNECLLLDVDNILDCVLDKSQFQDGINDISYLCGQISALTTVGVSAETAAALLFDSESTRNICDNNIECSNITAKAAQEHLKTEQENVYKQSL